jgi:asparagine synthase (glutamine-hydrolysing)
MCGITGFISTQPEPRDAALLQRMNDAIVHRGPDDAGSWSNAAEGRPGSDRAATVHLAMRRLAIIDLVSGHQPISNETGTCWIVFNGEIYNHAALRKELEAAGHRFSTRSDTETIVHAYEEWGEECVRHLRGMYAFAIWDERRSGGKSREGTLFLARDPVGIKPLYWTRTRRRFLFGSEIKALLQDPEVPRQVSEPALSNYLTYLYTPPPLTMFEGIYQLPPGHRLVWQVGESDTEPVIEEYWSGPNSLLEGDAGPPVAPDELWEVLKDSVQAHLLSDVPLGAFLSGGLDSTAIVALMSELSPGSVRTFSIGFKGAGDYDESAYAREVADHFGAIHTEFHLDHQSISRLPEIVRMLDEPLADASVLPNYEVARMAREHVTVALTGIGGDELFGGYRRYFGDNLARRLQWLPRPVRNNVLLPALRLIPSFQDNRLGNATRLIQKFLEPLDLAPEQRYLAWNAFFSEEMKRALFARPPEPGSDRTLAHFERVHHRPFAEQAMHVDVKSYLPGDPLFLSDRMTMANSLEARVPFVDVPTMEFAGRIPVDQKLKGRQTKIILRQMLAGKVPETAVRRPKRGFGTPIDVWMRRQLSPLMDELLAEPQLKQRGYFDPQYVAWMRDQQSSGRRDFSQHLWALMVFELWHRTFIDEDHSSRRDLTFADLDLSAEGGSLSVLNGSKRLTDALPHPLTHSTVPLADTEHEAAGGVAGLKREVRT